MPRRPGKQSHQNEFKFRHNKSSKTTKKILAIPITGLCLKCYHIVQWRKEYRKYKPLKEVRRCAICKEPKIVQNYHRYCPQCSVGKCAKCGKERERELIGRDEIEIQYNKRVKEIEDSLTGVRESERRRILREIKEEIKRENAKKYGNDDTHDHEHDHDHDEEYGEDFDEEFGEIEEFEKELDDNQHSNHPSFNNKSNISKRTGNGFEIDESKKVQFEHDSRNKKNNYSLTNEELDDDEDYGEIIDEEDDFEKIQEEEEKEGEFEDEFEEKYEDEFEERYEDEFENDYGQTKAQEKREEEKLNKISNSRVNRFKSIQATKQTKKDDDYDSDDSFDEVYKILKN